MKEMNDSLKEHYEVIRNILSVKKHINTFGITEEGLAFYNEDDQLGEVLNLTLNTDTDTTIVLEGLMDKLKELKEKLLEKLGLKKEKIKDEQEKVIKDFKTMLAEIEKIDEAVKRIEIDDNKEIYGVSFKELKTHIDFTIKTGLELNKSISIKKIPMGMHWVDITKFQKSAEKLNIFFDFKMDDDGIMSYPRKYNDKPIKHHSESSNDTISKLGWNKSNIKSVVEQFKKLYEIFQKEQTAEKIYLTIYSKNMDLIDNTPDDEEIFDKVYSLSCSADEGLIVLEDCIFALHRIVFANCKSFISTMKHIIK